MKLGHKLNPNAEKRLCEAVLTLKTNDEVRRFLLDLCTPAELQAMADRWLVVRMLRKGHAYREIHDETGVSVTTIGRVARYLEQGNGGYALVMERMSAKGRTT